VGEIVYKTFFGFSREPFEISPDPYFFYATPSHNEALACISYGVRSRKGFVVMTGEVGTGKTLLVRCLLDLLTQNHVAFAHVFNPSLSPAHFLEFVVGEFGLDSSNQSKAGLLRQFDQYLIGRYQRGLITTLVVDEAQHLTWELLEEIRLLTNLETAQQKLLQIVLVGQAELEDKLDSPALRQLKQRIALRCRLYPLRATESAQYIQRRLERAGAGARRHIIFPPDTVAAIHRHSRGIPRLINILADNGLISAYARQSASVTPDIIDQVATEFRLQVPTVPKGPSLEADDDSIAAAMSLLRLLSSSSRAERDKNHAHASGSW
jgi:general secretion pathway protein A